MAVRLGTSTPCRAFRKSGVSSDLTGGTTKTYLCFLSVNHCQKELQLVLVHCLLPGHWPAQRQDKGAPLSWPLILMGAMWNCSKKKRGLFSTVWKRPQIPCACPSSLSKNVCVEIAGLQPFVFCGSALLCLVSGRQVQLNSGFGLALHCSFHVFWCALWELIVLPMPKMLFSMSSFPADS